MWLPLLCGVECLRNSCLSPSNLYLLLLSAPPPLTNTQGPYDGPQGFTELDSRLRVLEAHKPRANRMFFLSIPPNVFLAATCFAADCASSK